MHSTSLDDLSVTVIVVKKGIGDMSSNPARCCLRFSSNANTLGKGMNQTIFSPAMGK